MFGAGSIWHWVIVLVVVVLIFGTKKLPSLGQDIGNALRGFKKAMQEEDKPKSKLETDTQTEKNESVSSKNKTP
jgi:sec-independent protein translocase protein TatA